DLDAFGERRAPGELHRLGAEPAQLERAAIPGRLAREVDERAHRLADLLAGALDPLEPSAQLGACRRVLEHELDGAEDGEERVVDLVRHAGGELADRSRAPALEQARDLAVVQLRQVSRRRDALEVSSA